MSDLDMLTVGLVMDMFIEKLNDGYDYDEVEETATQEDFDKF